MTLPFTIALAGNPNSGKTTIFNALTGLRQKTGNYPGVTVEKRIGRMRVAAESAEATVNGDGDTATATLDRPAELNVIDLPGTYSLISGSPDEQVAVDVLTGRIAGTPRPHAVVVVVDASNLQRNLYLVSQIIEMRLPMVIALNMMDVAERRGLRINADQLAARLKVPVVPVVGHKGRGLDTLKNAVWRAAVAPEPDWPLPPAFRRAVLELSGHVGDLAERACLSRQACAERLLCGEPVHVPVPDKVRDLAAVHRQQIERDGIDPMQADIEAHYEWIESVSHSVTTPVVDLRAAGRPVDLGVVPAERSEAASSAVPAPAVAPRHSLTERADRILLHKILGLFTFALIMGGLFVAIFFLAAPLMGLMESGIGALGGLVGKRLPDGTLKDLWTDGIVAGVGGVLVFVPQIAILFGLLAVLEDSGYLARAAFLMDRLLGKVGLSGRAFVPLLSGFACAIPGVMATRTIASPHDRLRTIFVLPFMSCSARLPVYTLLIGAFFASYSWWTQGGIMLGLYLLGIVAAFATAWVWKNSRHEPASSFILELPSYKVPQLTTVLRVMWQNTWAFVSRAGTIIFALSVILWAMTYWPRLPEAQADIAKEEAQARIAEKLQDPEYRKSLIDDEAVAAKFEEQQREYYARNPLPATGPTQAREFHDMKVRSLHEQMATMTAGMEAVGKAIEQEEEESVASAQLRHSVAGRFGHWIEPVIRPMGFDWKMGVGLVGAFAAREVFVSTMGIVYAVGDPEDDPQPLDAAMKADTRPDGTAVWTPLIALTMLAWFVLAMQCLSTVAIVRRETGGWKWPLLQLAYMNGLAYVLCVAIYQVGRLVIG